MNQQYQFNQYEHKELYGLPPTAKLKGFVVVNEEKEDMLAMIQDKNGFFLSAYTESPTQALIFKTVDKAKAMIEEIGKPLLVSAMYESKTVFCSLLYKNTNPLRAHFTIESNGC